MFDDRTDADEQPADLLEPESVAADLVLAVPRGALPVARLVAEPVVFHLNIADRLSSSGASDVVDVKRVLKTGSPTLKQAASAAE